jgi:deoxyribodipyrimidine photo-lyase
MRTVLWWVRRDLRLTDNQALASALANASRVLPVFILDPELLNSPDVGDKRVAFLFGGLHQLDADLRERGSRLVLRQGDPVQELAALVRETAADAVFAEEDYAPYAQQREARAAEALPLNLTGGLIVHPPEVVVKADGTPYAVFTPFRRAWKALPLPPARSVLSTPRQLPEPPDVASLPLPERSILSTAVPFPPGEAEAERRLQAFVNGEYSAVYDYAEGRDRLDLAGTSQLSPYLRFGMLSARQAVVSAQRAMEGAANPPARKSAETWLNELIWREFFISILAQFPEVSQQSFRIDLRGIAWENDEAAFSAWCQGRTGYPAVDAAMRQLVHTGWMHNRARMIVASFLVKDLLVDWRWGERFFMRHLVDGDPAANNGGWQWVAGTGTDAAPYFRIFSPVLQGRKYDPGGRFVRYWLPELTHVPDTYVHAPWEMPIEVQRQAQCLIGKDYPTPIVDHAWARERTLRAFSQARREGSPLL